MIMVVIIKQLNRPLIVLDLIHWYCGGAGDGPSLLLRLHVGWLGLGLGLGLQG